MNSFSAGFSVIFAEFALPDEGEDHIQYRNRQERILPRVSGRDADPLEGVPDQDDRGNAWAIGLQEDQPEGKVL